MRIGGKHVTILGVKMGDELKELLAEAADKDELPMNEWIVRLLAKHFCRPELAAIPRKRMGRPRKPQELEHVPAVNGTNGTRRRKAVAS